MIRLGTNRQRAVSALMVCASLIFAAYVQAQQTYGRALGARLNLNEEQAAALAEVSGRVKQLEKERMLSSAKIMAYAVSEDAQEEELSEMIATHAETVRVNLTEETAMVGDFYLSLDDEQKALWDQQMEKNLEKAESRVSRGLRRDEEGKEKQGKEKQGE